MDYLIRFIYNDLWTTSGCTGFVNRQSGITMIELCWFENST